MDTDSEEEISIGTESDMFPCNQEPSSSSEDRKAYKRSLTVARGRPEATEMWVLPCHSQICHLE
jgi:hypothetical protein